MLNGLRLTWQGAVAGMKGAMTMPDRATAE